MASPNSPSQSTVLDGAGHRIAFQQKLAHPFFHAVRDLQLHLARVANLFGTSTDALLDFLTFLSSSLTRQPSARKLHAAFSQTFTHWARGLEKAGEAGPAFQEELIEQADDDHLAGLEALQASLALEDFCWPS